MLTLGVVSDVHFGPEARFDGKLRKLTARSPELLEGVVGELEGEGGVRFDFGGQAEEQKETEADVHGGGKTGSGRRLLVESGAGGNIAHIGKTLLTDGFGAG